jgi:hypothetical protein
VGIVAIHTFLSAQFVTGDKDFRFRPGLRNSPNENRLDAKQLMIITKSLRERTGFAELDFDENGFLTLGDRMNFSGGSASARKLFIATLEMKKAIYLESCLKTSSVSFARIANHKTFECHATGARINACSIQIDFSDFSWLRGDKQALASFDPGFVVIHELGHAVLGLSDSYDNLPGDCEEMVNRIRRELNLPERQTYIARVNSAALSARTGRAELIFKSKVGNSDPGSIFRLSWDTRLVGQIVD